MRYWVNILASTLFIIIVNSESAYAIPLTPQKDSTVITYHENGEIKEKGSYKKGKKHGKWATYNANGALIKLVKYKKGVFWWERLYKKGKLSQITDRKGNVTKMKDCGC